ncbi:MAG TPA: dienelactone hydrolase family protein [Steroidobacteraceae bacterium]|jgi:phospholipase/carboxylesterase|nr:dienelactone hydrolase family protein [Steroidobacteraceae bacterium]
MPYTTHQSAEDVVLDPPTSPDAAVIWLHGLGADGFDFVPIVEELRLPPTMAVRFIFPHARPRPVTINNGFVMRAWYDITSLGPDRVEDEAGIRQSAGVLRSYMEKENARGIASERIVIAGFSQGGAIAFQAALRYPQRLGGVMALSTYLPLRESLAKEATPANRQVPILICHGVRDPMVPAALGAASRDLLTSLGYSVEWKTYPMEHSVCMEEVLDISKWLQAQLARNL